MSEGVSVIVRACDEISTTMTSGEGLTPSSTIDDDNQSDVECSLVPEEKIEENVTMECDTEGEECIDEESDHRNRALKNVSFPNDDSELVTGYLEPANPWECAYDVTLKDLISSYKKSCEHHCTEPLENVLSQLKKMDLSNDRVEEFSLKNEELTKNHCEALEAILKCVQFTKIDLESSSLDDESAETLFDMIEYYESAKYLNISKNCNIGARGWQECAQMIKKTQCLEQLDAKDIVLTQQHMNILKRPLQEASQLQILKLENCGLASRAFVILVSALKLNTGLKELYLADNGLEKQDALQLAALLRLNHHLQLLDISNNNIGDAGGHEILEGVMAQSSESKNGKGLSILIMWNNHLTRHLSGQFATLLSRSKSLETLNIGQNAMSDDFLEICKDSLKANRVLLQLGVQSTGLMIKGILALAEIIEKNDTLQRIDLRDNNIQLTGLTFLLLAMKKNTTVTQIDLDENIANKSAPIMEQYSELVVEVRGYCTRNEELAESSESSTESTSTTTEQRSRLSSVSSRKISLTCQTLSPRCPPPPCAQDSTAPRPTPSRGRLRSPAPSPIPSPVASPIPSPSRRFLVSRVSEASLTTTNTTPTPCLFPTVPSSRFRVTKVEPDTTTVPLESHNNFPNIPERFHFKLDTPEAQKTCHSDDLVAVVTEGPGECLKTNSCREISEAKISRNSNVASDATLITEDWQERDESLNVDNSWEENVLRPSKEASVELDTRELVERDKTSQDFEKNSETIGITDKHPEATLRPSMSLEEIMEVPEDVGTNLEIILRRPEKNTEVSQRSASSIDRLLSLFQSPATFFSSGFVDRADGKSPLRDGVNSMIALGDKFHQYLRDSRVGDQETQESSVNMMCDNVTNVPGSDMEASTMCDSRLQEDSINIFNDNSSFKVSANESVHNVDDHFESLESDKVLFDSLAVDESEGLYLPLNDDKEAFNEDIHEILMSMLDRIPAQLNLNGSESFYSDRTSNSATNPLIANNEMMDNNFLSTNVPVGDDKEFIEISNQSRGSFQESVDSGIGSECSSVGTRSDGVYIPREDEFFCKDAESEFICQGLQSSKLMDTKTVVDEQVVSISHDDEDGQVLEGMPNTRKNEKLRPNVYEYQSPDNFDEVKCQLEPKYQRYAKWRI